MDDKKLEKTDIYQKIIQAKTTNRPNNQDSDYTHDQYRSLFIRCAYEALTQAKLIKLLHDEHPYSQRIFIQQYKNLYDLLFVSNEQRVKGVSVQEKLLTQMTLLERAAEKTISVKISKFSPNNVYFYALQKINNFNLALEYHEKEKLQIILVRRWLEREYKHHNLIKDSLSELFNHISPAERRPSPIVILAVLSEEFLSEALKNSIQQLKEAKTTNVFTNEMSLIDFDNTFLKQFSFLENPIKITQQADIDKLILSYAGLDHDEELVTKAKKAHEKLKSMLSNEKEPVKTHQTSQLGFFNKLWVKITGGGGSNVNTPLPKI